MKKCIFSFFFPFIKSKSEKRCVSIGMRRPRYLRRGAEYHVVARANRQEFIFQSDRIKELFLETVERAKKKYNFGLRNFCIMGNHVHMMITPGPGENLSRIMQWILSVFAIHFNKIYGINGHVWYDRFRSTIVESLRQALHTFLYIAQNPVKAGIVECCFHYQYNGVRFLKENKCSILEPPDALSRYGLSILQP